MITSRLPCHISALTDGVVGVPNSDEKEIISSKEVFWYILIWEIFLAAHCIIALKNQSTSRNIQLFTFFKNQDILNLLVNLLNLELTW